VSTAQERYRDQSRLSVRTRPVAFPSPTGAARVRPAARRSRALSSGIPARSRRRSAAGRGRRAVMIGHGVHRGPPTPAAVIRWRQVASTTASEAPLPRSSWRTNGWSGRARRSVAAVLARGGAPPARRAGRPDRQGHPPLRHQGLRRHPRVGARPVPHGTSAAPRTCARLGQAGRP
jgi:hypothetical protein